MLHITHVSSTLPFLENYISDFYIFVGLKNKCAFKLSARLRVLWRNCLKMSRRCEKNWFLGLRAATLASVCPCIDICLLFAQKSVKQYCSCGLPSSDTKARKDKSRDSAPCFNFHAFLPQSRARPWSSISRIRISVSSHNETNHSLMGFKLPVKTRRQLEID